MLNSDLTYKVHVHPYTSGASVNTDYSIAPPDVLSDYNCLLIDLKVSNTSGAEPSLDTYFDINYVGILKKNNIYQITNSNCTKKSMRATWVYWS